MLKRCTCCHRFSDVRYLDNLGRCKACQPKANKQINEPEKEI